MSRKPKLEKGWFFDVANLNVQYREVDTAARNTGDYHHHNWVGPYKTFTGAKLAGLYEIRSEINVCRHRLREFAGLRKPRTTKA